jgi:hypothetical protein
VAVILADDAWCSITLGAEDGEFDGAEDELALLSWPGEWRRAFGKAAPPA